MGAMALEGAGEERQTDARRGTARRTAKQKNAPDEDGGEGALEGEQEAGPQRQVCSGRWGRAASRDPKPQEEAALEASRRSCLGGSQTSHGPSHPGPQDLGPAFVPQPPPGSGALSLPPLQVDSRLLELQAACVCAEPPDLRGWEPEGSPFPLLLLTAPSLVRPPILPSLLWQALSWLPRLLTLDITLSG